MVAYLVKRVRPALQKLLERGGQFALSGVLPAVIGPFTMMVDADGAVLAAGWTAQTADLLPQVHPDLRGGESVARKDLGPASRAAPAGGRHTGLADAPGGPLAP